MHYDQFLGQVQHRARLSGHQEAVAAIRATFETLAERLPIGQLDHVASQLPQELALFLVQDASAHPDRFGLEDFYDRVTARENVDRARAIYHSGVVLEVLGEAVSPGLIARLIHALPPDWRRLFPTRVNGEGAAAAAATPRPAPLAAGDPAVTAAPAAPAPADKPAPSQPEQRKER